MSELEKKDTRELRVIKTGRNIESINEAIQNGYKAVVKLLEPSDKIASKFALYQHKETGFISIIHDYRLEPSSTDFECIIPWTYYYPHTFESQFAAYLVPPDIELGERVFLEDLIEDFVGAVWNQGNAYRLKSCEAIWNGNAFEIDYKPRSIQEWIG